MTIAVYWYIKHQTKPKKNDYPLMQVKSIAERSKHSAILLTFIKVLLVIKTFVLSILEWPLKAGFTVPAIC